MKLTVEGGEGMGVEANRMTAGPSINHSILSTVYPLPFLQCPTHLFLQFQLLYYPFLQHSPPPFFYPFNFKLLPLPTPPIPQEAEFLDVIGAKVLRVFPYTIHSHLTNGLGQSGLKLVYNVNIVPQV